MQTIHKSLALFLLLTGLLTACMNQGTKKQFPTTPQEDDLNLTAMIQPADSTSFFKDANYYNWCNSIVKDEKGLYHMFYARFPKRIGFFSWLTHSEIAHAVADRPEGPYRNSETLLNPRADNWDQITLHNVKVNQFGDKYYMYYTSTNSDTMKLSNEMLTEIGKTGYSHKYWGLLRAHQRTGVAVSSSLNGPWKRFDKPLIQPHGAIKTITVNPSACQGTDGKYYMIVKGDALDKPGVIQAIGTSDSPTGPFELENKPAFDDIPTEDVCMWFDKTRARFYAIFHAHQRNFIGLITSEDGINWQKAKHYEVCKKQIPMKDGSVIKVDRMERPNVYIEDDRPVLLSFAVKKGNDAYVVFFKLSDEIVSMK